MSRENLREDFVEAIVQLDEEKVIDLTGKLIANNYDKSEIFRLLNIGADRVGVLFEQGEYFIADFMVSGKIYANVLSCVTLSESEYEDKNIGTILMGVVKYDIHDIGKDIIKNLLKAEGFRIIDIGVDVPIEKFVQAALEYRPNIITLSGILTYSTIEMKNTIDALDAAGVRDFASIIIGGACTDSTVAKNVNADYWACNPMDTLEYCLSKVEKNEN